MMKKFRVDQHVEADEHLFLFAVDYCAADFVADAEDLQKKILWHRQEATDFQFRAMQRDPADQASHGGFGAEVMADENDSAWTVYGEFLIDTVPRNVFFCVRAVLQRHGTAPSSPS
ncbi:hypothetical protein GGQ71_001638 [Rhizobium taibaishanense]|uniref:Uncharacterized protein n=1 Tax=Allorhizobium taibaishanense TaxID=887144 RepID=A0A7W6HLC8_9HYPH|nr:hypothetical protein [Allorhizobium taibaishanense]